MLRRTGMAGILLCLAACSSEPTESEILDSLQTALSQSGQELLGGYQNAPTVPTIKAIEKIQCEYESGANRYACDINMVLDTPAGEIKERGRVNLVEEGDGWVVME